MTLPEILELHFLLSNLIPFFELKEGHESNKDWLKMERSLLENLDVLALTEEIFLLPEVKKEKYNLQTFYNERVEFLKNINSIISDILKNLQNILKNVQVKPEFEEKFKRLNKIVVGMNSEISTITCFNDDNKKYFKKGMKERKFFSIDIENFNRIWGDFNDDLYDCINKLFFYIDDEMSFWGQNYCDKIIENNEENSYSIILYIWLKKLKNSLHTIYLDVCYLDLVSLRNKLRDFFIEFEAKNFFSSYIKTEKGDKVFYKNYINLLLLCFSFNMIFYKYSFKLYDCLNNYNEIYKEFIAEKSEFNAMLSNQSSSLINEYVNVELRKISLLLSFVDKDNFIFFRKILLMVTMRASELLGENKGKLFDKSMIMLKNFTCNYNEEVIPYEIFVFIEDFVYVTFSESCKNLYDSLFINNIINILKILTFINYQEKSNVKILDFLRSAIIVSNNNILKAFDRIIKSFEEYHRNDNSSVASEKIDDKKHDTFLFLALREFYEKVNNPQFPGTSLEDALAWTIRIRPLLDEQGFLFCLVCPKGELYRFISAKIDHIDLLQLMKNALNYNKAPKPLENVLRILGQKEVILELDHIKFIFDGIPQLKFVSDLYENRVNKSPFFKNTFFSGGVHQKMNTSNTSVLQEDIDEETQLEIAIALSLNKDTVMYDEEAEQLELAKKLSLNHYTQQEFVKEEPEIGGMEMVEEENAPTEAEQLEIAKRRSSDTQQKPAKGEPEIVGMEMVEEEILEKEIPAPKKRPYEEVSNMPLPLSDFFQKRDDKKTKRECLSSPKTP